MNANARTDDWISDLVGTFYDPIIVWPGGWGESVPNDIRTQITLERLIENMKRAKGQEPTGTDAEVVAYLMTTSLSQPLSDRWARIYFYVAHMVMKRVNKVGLPDDLKVEKLSDYDMRELNELKAWIYRQRTDMRKERDRARRREEKQTQKQAGEQAQPDLFAAAENSQVDFFAERR